MFNHSNQSFLPIRTMAWSMAMTLAVSTGAARAASFASAEVGPLTVTTSGGSVVFDTAFHSGVSVQFYDTLLGLDGSVTYQGAEPYGSVASSFESEDANWAVSAGVAAGADPSSPIGISYAASGYSQGTAVAGNVSGYQASASPSYSDWISFTISANTTVTFSALAIAGATTTIGNDPSWPDGESAQASASFYAVIVNGSESYDSLDVEAYYSSAVDPLTGSIVYSGSSDSASRWLQVSVTNNTDEDQFGYFNAYVSVVGQSYQVSAVPEPGGYALLSAGLGFVVFVARRRSKTPQPR